MGIQLKAYFERPANASVNSLSTIKHPALTGLPLPNFTKGDLSALEDAMNTRIINECADKGIYFAEGFKPLEKLVASENSKLFWDTSGKEQDFLIERIGIMMNLPLAFYDQNYPGHQFAEFEKTRHIQGVIENVLGLHNYKSDQSGAALDNGKKITLMSQDSVIITNTPNQLRQLFNCVVHISGEDYTLAPEDDDFSFAPVLDIDLNGRAVVKLFYNLDDHFSPKNLEELASKALSELDHHSEIYAVKCEPITISMLRPDFDKLNDTHIISVENPHYKDNTALNQLALVSPKI
ncbi:MAG: hypothetical protein CL561_10730 [Alphaproteobacteria bacterium]|nr:hypothetical protein [Alphaproteobacteria bacterium]|tara:strand:+ start:1722 stop:2600 length:879 start_codon:yes stop_codon:yes gene_type:complete